MDEKLPLTIVTGFLGSGKTTLVQRFLKDNTPTGVVVNEFGEIGLDHELFVHSAEHVELLGNGCLCCARRSDIGQAIHQLIRKSRATDSGGFQRSIIETSGMADPAPIISTIIQDPWLRNNIELTQIIAVIDAVAGIDNLRRHQEAVRQIAIADTVIITKSDIRGAASIKQMTEHVLAIAPDVLILNSQDEQFDPKAVISGPREHHQREVVETCGPVANPHKSTDSFIVEFGDEVDWPAFTIWLSALLHRHGERILRVKGKVFSASTGKPLVIHGVQHIMHPPTHLSKRRREGEVSSLVFISQGLKREEIDVSLSAFLNAVSNLNPQLLHH